jgi:hypothetical protein
MKNLAYALRLALSDLDPMTVRDMGWTGLNREFLSVAESEGLTLLVTGDKTVQF